MYDTAESTNICDENEVKINANNDDGTKSTVNESDDPCPSKWLLENVEDKYILGKVMGIGSFGTVRKVQLRDDSSHGWTKKLHSLIHPPKYHGCKTISKESVDGDVNILKQEVCNLELAKGHPRLLQIEQVFEDKDNVHIITELITGGELYTKISEMQQRCRYFDDEDAAFMVRNILHGISYLHDVAGIVHRDLKVSNFMFRQSSTGHNNIRDIKIIDFGLSQKVHPNTGLVTGCVGNAYYVAPEVLSADSYTTKVDIWSVGVIAYLILSLTLPFQAKDERETIMMLQNINNHKPTYSSKRWKNVDQDAVDFCKLLMQIDPSLRPTAREAMNHPWIVKYCGKSPLESSLIFARENDIDHHHRRKKTYLQILFA